jgi:hypothetical protein
MSCKADLGIFTRRLFDPAKHAGSLPSGRVFSKKTEKIPSLNLQEPS